MHDATHQLVFNKYGMTLSTYLVDIGITSLLSVSGNALVEFFTQLM